MNNTKKEALCDVKLIPTTGRLIATIAIIISFGLIAGCKGDSTSSELTPEQESAIADSVWAIAENANAAWEQLDAEAYLDYYSDDAHFYYHGTHYSRTDLENLVNSYLKGLQQSTIEILEEPQVRVLGPKAAIVSFRYKGTNVNSNGNSNEVTAAISAVLEHRQGEWKIVLAHESTASQQETS